MKYLLSLLFLFLSLAFTPSVYAQSVELLTSPWHIQIAGGNDVNLYQGIPSNSLIGKQSLTLTYDLHGTCIRNSLDSAIIFDQNGWKTISLYDYGNHCLNGVQTATIPLSAFTGLNTTQAVGTFHTRFWYGSPLTVDITSAKLNPIATPTPSPTPQPSPDWPIQAVDVMKYTKDVVCNQPSQATIDTMVQRAVEIGATHVAIATQYDNTTNCGAGNGDALALTTKWVNSIRSHGLKVWHRHMSNAFEGINGVPKSSKDYLELISAYIIAHPTLFADGDIFTPTPEPDSAGIGGVTYCGNPSNCAFPNAASFNQWIRDAQLVSKLSFTQIGLPNMKIGYYGTSGFIVWGENNPDWVGKGFLEQGTVDAMGGVIAMDSYPETYGGTMASSIDGAHAKWPNATIVISEYGTITATSSAQRVSQVNAAFTAMKRPYVTGVNYWVLAGGPNETLLNPDLTPNATYNEVQSFYKGFK